MDRLFLRVYLYLFAALACGVLLVRIAVVPFVDARVGKNIEETFAPVVAVMVETLAERRAEGRDSEAMLARARDRFHADATMIPRREVSLEATEEARLDRGDVVRTGNPFDSLIYARIGSTGDVLRIGPFNSVHPWGGARGLSLFALLVAALSAGVYAILRPIRRRLAGLSDTAAVFGRGDLTVRAKVGPDDPIGSLATSFNRMANELQRLIARQEELLHMTSHELRTPMQRLHFTMEDLRAAAPEATTAIERMDRDLGEMDQLIGELLTYVRLEERATVTAQVAVTELLADLCTGLATTAPAVKLVGPTAAPTATDAVELEAEERLVRRAVSNLVVNALRYARARVEVAIEFGADAVRIRVDDDGTGIAPADRERIFEPFVRLEGDGSAKGPGFGLGLAIARRIAKAHGGGLDVASSPLGGARFELWLPAPRAA